MIHCPLCKAPLAEDENELRYIADAFPMQIGDSVKLNEIPETWNYKCPKCKEIFTEDDLERE